MNVSDQFLIGKAIEVRNNAYAPYSNYLVGAALLASSGKIYLGCNMENASYGAAICAERSAFSSAIAAGERSFESIAIVGGPKGSGLQESITPCGICRQVMSELCKSSFRVILAASEERYSIYKFGQLLPLSFEASNLK